MKKDFRALCSGKQCAAGNYYYRAFNVTRSTVSGIAAYRSALTLDWLAAEDSRQRELVAAFETEAAPLSRVLSTECIDYPRPSTGKVARLMLDLLKNLEGDDPKLVPELIQVLIRAKLLVQMSILENEPDLETLVKIPDVMLGEPHVTFPKILAMLWMSVTDSSTTRKMGWCPINKVNKYIAVNKPAHIAKHMRALEPIITRARFIVEEFIQKVTPLNMYQMKSDNHQTERTARQYPPLKSTKAIKKSNRYRPTDEVSVLNVVQSSTESSFAPLSRSIDEPEIIITSSAVSFCPKLTVFVIVVAFVSY